MKLILLSVIVISLFMTSQAYAADRTFDSDTTLSSNETIENGETWIINPGVILTVPISATFTIEDGGTLVNDGTLNIQFQSDLTNDGLIDNFGQIIIYDDAALVIDGVLIIEDDATIIVNINGDLVIFGSLIIEPSATLLIDGTIDNNGELIIGEDGTIDNEGQIFINDGAILDNNGNLIIYHGGSVTNDGLIDNDEGQIFINDGAILDNNGNLIIDGGSVTNDGLIDNEGQIFNFGLITLQSGALINNFYLIENIGTITNNGTITNFDCGIITGNSVGGSLQSPGVCTTPANHRIFTSDTIISFNETIENGETWIINEGITVTILSSATIIIQNGAALEIDGILLVEFNSTISNFGDILITPSGAIVNHDVLIIQDGALIENYNLIKNFGLIDNQGTIINFDCAAITRNAVSSNDSVSFGVCDILPVDFNLIDHVDVDVNYDIDSQTLIIDYDFGENPYRESCLFKAEVFLKYNGIVTDFAYAGDEINIVYPTGTTINRMGLIYPQIDCSGRIIFEHVKDFPTSDPEFLQYFGSFYTILKEQFREEFDDIYYLFNSNSKINGIKAEHKVNFVIDSNANIVDKAPVCSVHITWNEFTLMYDLNTLIKFHADRTDIDDNLCGISYESEVFPDPNEYFATVDYTPPANTSHHNTSTSTKKKDGGCADCTPPTFGKNKHGVLIVTDGFSYNGNSTDVTDFHTPYPLITTVTNQTNTVFVKVYENDGLDNIKIVQFGLGMPEVGSPLSDAQTLIEIWLDKSQVIDLVQVDKNNLVTISNFETSVVECGGINGECLAIKLEYYYRDQPKYNVMAINAIDYSKNPQTNYFNAGIEVIGESLNEPLTQQVAVSNDPFYPQKRGLTTITLSDYKTDTWIDEYGYVWGTNEHGPYLVDIIPHPEQISDDISPWSEYSDRLHSEFGYYLKLQQEKAAIILDEITSLP